MKGHLKKYKKQVRKIYEYRITTSKKRAEVFMLGETTGAGKLKADPIVREDVTNFSAGVLGVRLNKSNNGVGLGGGSLC